MNGQRGLRQRCSTCVRRTESAMRGHGYQRALRDEQFSLSTNGPQNSACSVTSCVSLQLEERLVHEIFVLDLAVFSVLLRLPKQLVCLLLRQSLPNWHPCKHQPENTLRHGCSNTQTDTNATRSAAEPGNVRDVRMTRKSSAFTCALPQRLVSGDRTDIGSNNNKRPHEWGEELSHVLCPCHQHHPPVS